MLYFCALRADYMRTSYFKIIQGRAGERKETSGGKGEDRT